MVRFVLVNTEDGTETTLYGKNLHKTMDGRDSDDDELDKDDPFDENTTNLMQLQAVPPDVHEEYESDDEPGDCYDFEDMDDDHMEENDFKCANNNKKKEREIKCILRIHKRKSNTELYKQYRKDEKKRLDPKSKGNTDIRNFMKQMGSNIAWIDSDQYDPRPVHIMAHNRISQEQDLRLLYLNYKKILKKFEGIFEIDEILNYVGKRDQWNQQLKYTLKKSKKYRLIILSPKCDRITSLWEAFQILFANKTVLNFVHHLGDRGVVFEKCEKAQKELDRLRHINRVLSEAQKKNGSTAGCIMNKENADHENEKVLEYMVKYFTRNPTGSFQRLADILNYEKKWRNRKGEPFIRASLHELYKRNIILFKKIKKRKISALIR